VGKNRYIFNIFIAVTAVLFSNIALGDIPDNNVLDTIVEKYQTASMAWTTVLIPHAKDLFWILATIEVAWTGINLALKRPDIGEVFGEIAKRVLFIMFFYTLLDRSGEWPKSIIDSFRMAADQANAVSGLPQSLTPSSVFDVGLKVVYLLTDAASVYDPMEGLAKIICALVIFVCLASVAAMMLVALIEMYIALNAGVIILGLGATRFTSEFAVNYMKFVVSIGIKLFAMQLLVGIGQNFVFDFLLNFKGTNTETFVFIGISVVLLILVKTIPDTLQAMITGSQFSGSGGSMLASGVTAAMGGLAGAAVGGAIGGTMAVSQAAQLASAEGHSGIRGAAATAGNLAKAGVDAIAGRFAGVPGSQHGKLGGQIAADLKQKRLSLPNSGGGSSPQPEAAGKFSQSQGNQAPEADIDPSMAFEENAVSMDEVTASEDLGPDDSNPKTK